MMGNNWQSLPHTPMQKCTTSCFLLSPLPRCLVCIGITGISETLVYLRTPFFCPSTRVGQCGAHKYEANQVCVGSFVLFCFLMLIGLFFSHCPWKLKTEPRYVSITHGKCLIGAFSLCAKDRHY